MEKITKLHVFLLLLNQVFANNIEYDGMVNIELMHALDVNSPSSFSERGNISIPSLRVGQAFVNQKLLSDDEQQLLRELALANKYYQIIAIVNGQDGNRNKFISYIKACMLAEAELTDILSVTLDYSGNVISVVAVVASTSTCEGASVSTDRLQEFSTTVHVRHTFNGPSPDTASYIQKLDREREAKDRGETVKDNRSFLVKYWMYIVPVVIIMVFSSVTNQEAPNNAGR